MNWKAKPVFLSSIFYGIHIEQWLNDFIYFYIHSKTSFDILTQQVTYFPRKGRMPLRNTCNTDPFNKETLWFTYASHYLAKSPSLITSRSLRPQPSHRPISLRNNTTCK